MNDSENQGVNRRSFITQMGAGFTSLALTGLLSQESFFTNLHAAEKSSGHLNPLAPKTPQLKQKAKSVIFLFMYGGPSQMETFDYKPEMYKYDGKTVHGFKTHGRGGKRDGGRIVGPKWKFKQYGQSGMWVSDLFPHLANHVDDIAFVNSMVADSPIHGSAMLQMNSGELISGHPSMGSWVNYGLGSMNENLPGYVVMLDQRGGPISGAKNWTSGYMPASYQATVLRSNGVPILNLGRYGQLSKPQQREMLDTLKKYNSQHLADRVDNSDLSSRIANYELAYRMQQHAPEAVDISKESEETKELYGLNNKLTEPFGRRMLITRRLVERGVRYIQVYSGGGHNDENWDAHNDMKRNHTLHAGETDLPIAGLMTDLKRRGLLDETLIVWGGEFGRQATAEYAKGTGRDHNAKGFTMWMAGGGIKGGQRIGTTDEWANEAQGRFGQDKFKVKHLHATVLHQMGIDPNKLSYFYGGLDRKLVGVEHCNLIHQAIS